MSGVSRLAIAAAITINEFVYGLFTGNPTMADAERLAALWESQWARFQADAKRGK
mgnify:CR=1 FL=1